MVKEKRNQIRFWWKLRQKLNGERNGQINPKYG